MFFKAECHKESKNGFKNGTTTDCFEPIFGFLGQFCFEKHRSASWSRIGMFSELSGRSATLMMMMRNLIYSITKSDPVYIFFFTILPQFLPKPAA